MNLPKNFSQSLRWLGSFSILIAVIQFLVSGKYDLNSYMAHNLFLAFNALLCVLGVMAFKKYRDEKSARTFLSLSLAILPTQFAQLGAFIFNRLEGTPKHLPELAQIALPESVGLLSVSLISVIILVPILLLGFHVLNRNEAKSFSLLFGLQSAILMLPLRNNHYIFLLVLAMAAINYFVMKKDERIHTFETIISKAILYIPCTIMLSRGLMYPHSAKLFALILAVLAYLFMRPLSQLLQGHLNRDVLGTIALRLGNLIGMASLLTFAYAFGLSTLLSFLLLAIGTYLMSFLSFEEDLFLRFIAHLFTIFASLNALTTFALAAQLAILMLPAFGASLAFHQKDKLAFTIQLLTLTGGIIGLCIQSISMPFLNSWFTLAALGVLLIASSTMLERQLVNIKLFLSKLKQNFA